MSGLNPALLIAVGLGVILFAADFLLPDRWKKRAGWILLPLGLIFLIGGLIGVGHDLGRSRKQSASAEPTARSLPKNRDELSKLRARLADHPAPFWMITASELRGVNRAIREDRDEQGAFETQLENLLADSNWEDLILTQCKDNVGFLDKKHAAGIIDNGNIPLARWLHGGVIDASVFAGVAECPYPAYEDVFHGILIEAPLEFMQEAQFLNDELTKLMIPSSVRQADIIPGGEGRRLEMIVIHVGTK